MMKKRAVLLFLVLAVIGCGVYLYTHSTSYILRKNNGGKYLFEHGNYYSTVWDDKFPLAGTEETLIDYDALFELRVAELFCIRQKNDPMDGALQLRFTLTNHSAETVKIYYGMIVEQRINGVWYQCNTPRIIQTSLHYPLEPEETMGISATLVHIIYCYPPIEFKNFSPGRYRVLVEVESDKYVPLEFTLTRAQIRAAERAWRAEKQAAK